MMTRPVAGEELQIRIANLSEAELDRLEAFRCSKLAKANTRKVCAVEGLC